MHVHVDTMTGALDRVPKGKFTQTAVNFMYMYRSNMLVSVNHK